MSRFENLSRQPTIELVIGAEVIFGQPAKDVFPALYHDIQSDIVDRARILLESLKSKNDPIAGKKRRLLTECIKRATQAKLGL